MATQLIKHLKKCADNDAIYKPLESQWAMEDTNPKPTTFIKRDSAPRDKDLPDILKKYPLDVKIEKENEGEDKQSNYLRITITDLGTGISRHDLEFLMSMGSSKKNHKKR